MKIPVLLLSLSLAVVSFLQIALGSPKADELRRAGDWGASLRPPSSEQPSAIVTKIVDGGAAAKADLRIGDLIIRINGEVVKDSRAFARQFNALRGGDTAELHIMRAGADETPLTKRITLPPKPKESFPEFESIYDTVENDKHQRLRTIVTKPKEIVQGARLPVIFLVPWLSADTVEYVKGETDGTSSLLLRLARVPRLITVRVDKPGVGDSEGITADTDFKTELSGYRAAFRSLSRYDFIDPERIFVLGISNGGGVAPLVVEGKKVRGYIVSGSWVKTWYEHMLEHERRRLRLTGKSAGDVSSAMKLYAEFYTEYLIHRRSPGDILRERPDFKPIWYGQPDQQYGRPSSFFHQLQELNLAALWDQVDAPVLSVCGEHDWIMSQDDQEAIPEFVNRRHPGSSRFVLVPKADHNLEVHDSREASFRGDAPRLDSPTAQIISDWVKEQL